MSKSNVICYVKSLIIVIIAYSEVPFPLVNKLEYYTISKNGFTYWSLSENHFTELDVWLKEYEIYCKLRKVGLFV